MTMEAIGINTAALGRNLNAIDNNQTPVPGETPSDFSGFGQVKDMANSNNVAYFFAEYATEDTNINAPNANLRISTEEENSGGRQLLEDIQEKAGDDGILTQEELQAWADEIGYTGDISEVMDAFLQMDNYLCGDGTFSVTDAPEETVPEETQPEQTEGQEDSNWFKDFGNWILDGIEYFLPGVISGPIGSIFGR